MFRMHVIIGTHTPRHLRRCLLALARQRRRADSITVTCDVEDAEIERTVRDAAAEFGLGILLVQRAHTGKSRSSQVRNNGVRALMRSPASPQQQDWVIFLDGDIVLSPDALAVYERLATARDLLLGFRIDLTPEQTEAFDEGALSRGGLPVRPTTEQLIGLDVRHRRYWRQALLRRFGLAKPHKPKLLSANFAVRFEPLLAVNGFDEGYEGYGQEDDDFGRRLYLSGCRVRVAIRDVHALHLFHPTRAPGAWHESPNAERFAHGGPVKCVLGIDNPAAQPDVRVMTM